MPLKILKYFVILLIAFVRDPIAALEEAVSTSDDTYESLISDLHAKKDAKKLYYMLWLTQGRIGNDVRRKIEKMDTLKNPHWPSLLKALEPYAKDENSDLSDVSLSIKRMLSGLDLATLTTDCQTIEKKTLEPDAHFIALKADFYAYFCATPKSGPSLKVFLAIKNSPNVPDHVKVETALRIDVENEEIADTVLGIAKKYQLGGNRDGLLEITFRFCRGKSSITARRVVRLFEETIYQDVAVACLQNMKPEIWPILAKPLEEGTEDQVKKTIWILEKLAPKGVLPHIKKRIATSKNWSEIHNLRFLAVQISGEPDSVLENELLHLWAADQKREIVGDFGLVLGRYYAYLNDAEKVDEYLLTYLTKRKKAKYESVCRNYRILKKLTTLALKTIERIQNEEKDFKCVDSR